MITFLIVGLTSPNLEPPNISLNTGHFMSSCLNEECDEPLMCDAVTHTCRFPEGVPCTSQSSCITGLICSGICATGPVGGLDELCPCDENYVCVPQGTGQASICKGDGGAPCTSYIDCTSFLCNRGICSSGAPNSYPCTNDSSCASNNCSYGYCQPENVVTGVLGSFCSCSNNDFGASCNEDLFLNCQCDEITNIGYCMTASQGILSSCSTNSLCSTNLICYNQELDLCNVTDPGSCLCLFPRNDPNLVSGTVDCIIGMVPGQVSQEQCFNDIGLGCDDNNLCYSTNCGGPAVIATYQFITSDGGDTLYSNTMFPGANITRIDAPIVFPSNINYDPHKMFAVSLDDSMIDIIYVVDKNQGLLSITYDTSGELTPELEILLPQVNDAACNNDTYVAVIDNQLYMGSSFDNLTNLGYQYTNESTLLSINYVSVSVEDDLMIVTHEGNVYIRRNGTNSYELAIGIRGGYNGRSIVGVTGPAMFYYDEIQNLAGTGAVVCDPSLEVSDNPISCPSYNNFAFIGEYEGRDHVVQFSGNIGGIAMPVDRAGVIDYQVYDYNIYSTEENGMLESNIITLSRAYQDGVYINNVVSLSLGGNTTVVPYLVGDTSKCCASRRGYYIMSRASCRG